MREGNGKEGEERRENEGRGENGKKTREVREYPPKGNLGYGPGLTNS